MRPDNFTYGRPVNATTDDNTNRRVGSIIPLAAAAMMVGVASLALRFRITEASNSDLRRGGGSDCVNSGDTAWMICATTFVMLQTPACGMCQSGLVRRKNSLSVIGQVDTATWCLSNLVCFQQFFV